MRPLAGRAAPLLSAPAVAQGAGEAEAEEGEEEGDVSVLKSIGRRLGLGERHPALARWRDARGRLIHASDEVEMPGGGRGSVIDVTRHAVFVKEEGGRHRRFGPDAGAAGRPGELRVTWSQHEEGDG